MGDLNQREDFGEAGGREIASESLAHHPAMHGSVGLILRQARSITNHRRKLAFVVNGRHVEGGQERPALPGVHYVAALARDGFAALATLISKHEIGLRRVEEPEAGVGDRIARPYFFDTLSDDIVLFLEMTNGLDDYRPSRLKSQA
ncbi:hypothetical protein [Antarcticirhabdus aurantiaca]|uniref:Uncharacterized protein n=1 Tax=Antarcticirhabdus aurantiaca TaxID=2606717 RepID=A0ACD4NKY5_9HYPH|nr:hypothetical protein [Antarcticirhabdus aurantiaca]WAJ27411.1 hypothetical protein OXU80_21575 [Jeongeuplla avenae]